MPHYYTKTGEARHWVDKKSGPGQRPTTIRDAKALDLVPGVTTVLDVLAKPGLERWKINQAVHAVVTAPDIEGETLDQKLVRVLETERQQDQESERAKDLGTEIHGAIEAYFSANTEPSETIKPYIMPAIEYIEKRKPYRAVCERIVVGSGYAGKVDLMLVFEDSYTLLVDFKTCKRLPTNGSYLEHRLQLGAYAEAVEDGDMAVDTANMYISTTKPGEIYWSTNADWKKDFECFEHVLAIWRHINGL